MANNDIRMRVLLNVDGKSSVVEVSSSVKELQNALEATKNKAEKMRVAMSHLANISVLANNAMTGFHNLGAAMQPFIDKANNAAVVQTKLKTVMEQRMRATGQDVAAINQTGGYVCQQPPDTGDAASRHEQPHSPAEGTERHERGCRDDR